MSADQKMSSSTEATTITLDRQEDDNSKTTINKGKSIKSIVNPKAATSHNKGLSILDFVLRLLATAAALAATATMASTQQVLPFFTQFFQFRAEYNDIPTFSSFLIANGVISGYLVLSLPFSFVCIVRPHAAGPRLFLIVLDTVIMAVNLTAAAAAAAIVYLAHNGNSNANWFPICQQFGDYCQSASGAVVASFVAAAILSFLVLVSAFALRRM